MARTKRKARDAFREKKALKAQKVEEVNKENASVDQEANTTNTEEPVVHPEPFVHPFVRSMWETLRLQTVYLCNTPSTPAQDNLRAALQAACQEVQNLPVEQ